MEGREWTDMPRKRYYDRFPAEAEGKVPPAVWNLSRDSAGMMGRFKSNASAVHVRYTLLQIEHGDVAHAGHRSQRHRFVCPR